MITSVMNGSVYFVESFGRQQNTSKTNEALKITTALLGQLNIYLLKVDRGLEAHSNKLPQIVDCQLVGSAIL